ncbi:response regulator [Pseudobacteriovorax antillogorgiicola]|uniref:Response regulator receiver domain-containing protein n=1 Tax=Pseudobacteriovorax antillogorgiicola TaxID=1513793 RepID=A0A1Y6BX67_9BACT|nr:response regulator [Pseudobacteriovorax antillogorgiicola]TCS53179.1 response regulator receiver domain-containing protein [Pseudobacteriovorax antillogorgiicola]SMF24565.1 Response regulator receiver domain-containing protein [Pseudobacteriovorax antillogorgiicola]
MKKILCVKDHHCNDEFIAQSFSKQGMKVAKAYGFQESFHIMRTFVPDAVLVDIKSLEEESGKQFVQNLRDNNRLSHIPIVGIFDCDLPEDLTRYRTWGCDEFFSKEQDLADISRLVNQVIEQSQLKIPKILLMEDDPDLKNILKDALEPIGVAVIDVCNGFDAIRIFKNQKFDMLITDIMVKGLNGFQLIEMVSKEAPDIPIIVITGAYPKGFDSFATKLGINTHFQKPFDMELFAGSIAEILQNQRDVAQKISMEL